MTMRLKNLGLLAALGAAMGISTSGNMADRALLNTKSNDRRYFASNPFKMRNRKPHKSKRRTWSLMYTVDANHAIFKCKQTGAVRELPYKMTGINNDCNVYPWCIADVA